MACAICMATNDYITKLIHKSVFSRPQDKDVFVDNVTNSNFLVGVIMLILSMLGNTVFFSGRRMTLLLFTIIILTIWNVIWISFSDIITVENNNKSEQGVEKTAYFYSDLDWFDIVMFLVQDALCRAIYYTIIIVGPIDISKTQVLKENTHIYALIMCTIGAIKYMLYGVLLDEYVGVIIQADFFYERLIDIVLNLVAICCMITLFRDEVGEIYR